MSPQTGTVPPLWAIRSTFDHSHSKTNVFLWSDGHKLKHMKSHYLLSCQWALLRTVDFLIFIPSHQVFIHADKISPQPSLLSAEQSPHSQPLLMWIMLQSLNHLCGPVLDSLHIFLVQRNPELDTALQLSPHWRWTEKKITSLKLLATYVKLLHIYSGMEK